MRMGIFGAGAMARTHAAALLRIAGVELAGIGVRTATPSALALGAEHGVPVLTGEQLLAQTNVDAVVIATPTDSHLDLARAAAQTGKHIFCEKPLARTLADGAALIEVCERAGVRLAVGQVLRYFAAYAVGHFVAQRGELGELERVEASRGGPFPTVASGWYADTARSGGVALDLMIHDFDWARWLFGPIAEITAHSPIAHRVVAELRFASGATGQITGSWAETTPFHTTFALQGSAGTLTHDSWQDAPPPETTAGVAVPAGAGDDDPYTLQMRDAIAWFAGGPPPRASANDAFEALRASLAALESMRVGRAVELL